MGADPIVLAETARFKVEVEIRDKSIHVRPIGTLNEDADLGTVLDFFQEHKGNSDLLTFDMGKLTGLNSCGVREWILFMERVQAQFKCRFEMLNELFIEQASIVPNLLGKKGTPVVAFAAPYFCQKCNKRLIQILKAENIKIDASGEYGLPAYKCPSCSNPVEFDALEDEYFHFLKHARSQP